MVVSQTSQAASHAAHCRWNSKLGQKERKTIGKFLVGTRQPRTSEQQAASAQALNKKLTKKQKHERAMKGVAARRLKKLQLQKDQMRG